MTKLDRNEFLARGKEFPEVSLDLSSERVTAYRAATGDSSTPPNLVPPAAVLALSLEPLLADLTLLNGAIHTGQEMRMRRVVAIGERLTARLTVANSSVRGGAVFASIDQMVLDESNKVVLEGRSNVIVAPDGPT